MNIRKPSSSLVVAALAMTNRVSTSSRSSLPKMRTIKDTSKTRNLQVNLPWNHGTSGENIITIEDMELLLRDVGSDMSMYISHITTLGRKRYPGNRHWHFKQNPKETGCLDVTYWPKGPMMWISMRRSEPQWVQNAGIELQQRMEQKLAENL